MTADDVYDWPGPLQPANEVSWNDAQAWFKQRQLAAAELRLPGEAEWEFACRAGTQTVITPSGLEPEMTGPKPVVLPITPRGRPTEL